MRILYLVPFFRPYDFGGAEISTELFARELSKEHEIFILTPNYGSWKKKTEKEGKLNICRFPFPIRFRKGVDGFLENIFFMIYLAFWTLRISKKYKINLIHIQNDPFVPGGGFAAVLLRKAYFITVRGHGFLDNLSGRLGEDELRYPYSRRVFLRLRCEKKILFPIVLLIYRLNLSFRVFSFKRATKLICVSKYMSKRITRDLDLRKNKAEVVYNIMPDMIKRKLHIKEEKVFLYVGRLCKHKGIDLLLESMREVFEKHPNWKLWLVGNTSVDHYKKLSKELNIEKNVIFFGWQPYDEMWEFYAKSRVVIMPSTRDEPLSRVLIEAGSLGKPIISTERGGSPEVVKNMYSGLLVKPEKMSLYNALLFAVENPSNIKQFRKNIRKTCKSLFNLKNNMEKLEKIYDGACK